MYMVKHAGWAWNGGKHIEILPQSDNKRGWCIAKAESPMVDVKGGCVVKRHSAGKWWKLHGVVA